MQVKRWKKNPILKPKDWNSKAKAIFNPAVVYYNGEILLWARIVEEYDNYTSRIGLFKSKDGFYFEKALNEYVIKPDKEYDKFSCEDPRATLLKDKIYITYVALDSHPLATKRPPLTVLVEVEDAFDPSKYKKLGIITPPLSDNKNVILFPEKIKGEYVFLHRPFNWTKNNIKKINNKFYIKYKNFTKWPENIEIPEYFPNKPSIWIARSKDFKNWHDFKVLIEPKYWWEETKIGAGTCIKTEYGWLVFYHGVNNRFYRVGAILLDLDNPEKVIGRTKEPIWEPRTIYEKYGDVNNVVFPTGCIKKEEEILIYSGLADKYIGIAKISLKYLIKEIIKNN